MINGDVHEFVDRIHYGDELIFLFRGREYFLQGYMEDGKYITYLDQWDPPGDDYVWIGRGDDGPAVEEFLAQKLWDGMDFWEAEKEMEWIY